MTREEIVRKLEPWRARVQRPAWKPLVEAGEGPVTGARYGGTPWIGPYAPWPECGHCQMPLSFFLQLDLGNLPQELDGRFGTGLLQLYYCTRDECQGYGGWEPFADDLSRVRVVQPTGPRSTITPAPAEVLPAQRIVGWSSFTDLPMPQEHGELGLQYTYNFKRGMLRLQCPEVSLDTTYPLTECPTEEIAHSKSGDKLAGWPAWVQGVEYPHCPRCEQRMILVLQVDSEDNLPFMFGDVGCGHITQCPAHKDVVAFGWACC